MKAAIWKGEYENWFVDKDGDPLPVKSITKFRHVPNEISYRTHFQLNDYMVTLNEKEVYKSLYANPKVYEIAGTKICAIIDIALSKGGPEAIAESF